ncbi:GNAT family N-acetyltransferase [Marinivivus vitaminiproducens]|uniref:GNAT family N-acetyltransferase n=1 Tax=Marinivivus vitaminiproducens TaxID=3035935 RepID=UPI003F9FB958
MPPAAATPALSLRRIVETDGPLLIEANRRARAYHEPWVDPFLDREGFDAWFTRIRHGAHVGLLAQIAGSPVPVGVVNLNDIVLGALRGAFLGYYGYPEWAGRGLMTEAVRHGLDVAFGELRLHRIEANIQPSNRASLRLVERLGFRREGYSPRYLFIAGEWRDHERWARLADDPPA